MPKKKRVSRSSQDPSDAARRRRLQQDQNRERSLSARRSRSAKGLQSIVLDEHTIIGSDAEPVRMDPEDIGTLARHIVTKKVFFAQEKADLENAFSTVMMHPSFRMWNMEKVGAIFEYLDHAGPVMRNGRPMFTSAKFVHTDDLDALSEAVAKLQS